MHYRIYAENSKGEQTVFYQGACYTDALLSYPNFIYNDEKFYFETNGKRKEVEVSRLDRPRHLENVQHEINHRIRGLKKDMRHG